MKGVYIYKTITAPLLTWTPPIAIMTKSVSSHYHHTSPIAQLNCLIYYCEIIVVRLQPICNFVVA